MFRLNLNVFNKLCGISADDGARGNVLGYYGTCGHNGILADGDTGQDDGTHANPGIAADVDGFAAQHHAVFEVVVVGDDAHVGTYHHAVVDGDAACSHAGQRVVHEDATANLHLAGEVNLKRRHQVTRLVETALEELLLQRTNLLWCKQMLAQSVMCLMASTYSVVAISTSAPELNLSKISIPL